MAGCPDLARPDWTSPGAFMFLEVSANLNQNGHIILQALATPGHQASRDLSSTQGFSQQALDLNFKAWNLKLVIFIYWQLLCCLCSPRNARSSARIFFSWRCFSPALLPSSSEYHCLRVRWKSLSLRVLLPTTASRISVGFPPRYITFACHHLWPTKGSWTSKKYLREAISNEGPGDVAGLLWGVEYKRITELERISEAQEAHRVTWYFGHIPKLYFSSLFP